MRKQTNRQINLSVQNERRKQNGEGKSTRGFTHLNLKIDAPNRTVPHFTSPKKPIRKKLLYGAAALPAQGAHRHLTIIL